MCKVLVAGDLQGWFLWKHVRSCRYVWQTQCRPDPKQMHWQPKLTLPWWWSKKFCVTENVRRLRICDRNNPTVPRSGRREGRRCSRNWRRCPPCQTRRMCPEGGCDPMEIWHKNELLFNGLTVQLNRRGPIWVWEQAPWLFSISLGVCYSPHVLMAPWYSVWNKCTKGKGV